MHITREYLLNNPNHIFVFGDNTIRLGKGGAAKLRDLPNTYGFITKKYPSMEDDSFYTPEEYMPIFKHELVSLCYFIKNSPDKTFLISKCGAKLANKYQIWEKVIKNGFRELENFDNVVFLYDNSLE